MSTNNKWTTENIPDQSGKIVIVTGANSGIGYEATRALALKGATIIMACRNLQKGETAAETIRNEKLTGEVKVMQLDLSDLSSIKHFAQEFRAVYTQLDLLINNAGVMATPYGKTADGFEMQFGTNHLGHFALTGLLIDMLRKTPQSRVVTVSSNAHMIGRINFNDLNSEKRYQKWVAYGQSKLANLLFAYELQHKLTENGGTTLSIGVHPGWTATNLQHNSGFFSFLNPILGQSQEMGALPTLFAATSPEIRGGEYVGPDGFLGQAGYPKVVQSNKRSHDENAVKRLWEVSEELTGVRFSF